MKKKDLSIKEIQETVESLLLKDGVLIPVIFIHTKDGALIVDVEEGMKSDEAKDNMIEALARMAVEKEAHKMTVVSECWGYKAPTDMTEEQIAKVVALGKHRHQFEKEEMYQIMEITKDGVNMLTRTFYRDDNTITFGDVVESSQVTLDRFKPLQDSLVNLN